MTAIKWAPWVVLFVVELVACGGRVRNTLDGAGGAPVGSGGEPALSFTSPPFDAGHAPLTPPENYCDIPQQDVPVALPDPATLAAATFASQCGVQLPDLSPKAFDPSTFQVILPALKYFAIVEQVHQRSECFDYGHTYKGWYFDDNVHPTRIGFCPETCRQIGEVGGYITMSFGCYIPPSP